MKQTINANIGSFAFTVDEDAYRELERYIDDIKSRFEPSEAYIVDDIEVRIAELLKEEISSPMQVVTIEMVRRTLAKIGRPEEFGERKNSARSDKWGYSQKSNRLVRIRDEKLIAGVCAGLARYLDVETTLIRVIAILALVLGSAGFWIYILLWICMPYDDEVEKYTNKNGRR